VTGRSWAITRTGLFALVKQKGVRRPLDPNTLIEIRWSTVNGPVVASTISGKQGQFKMTVAPGGYWVVPVAKGDEQVVNDLVTVQPGSYTVAKRSSLQSRRDGTAQAAHATQPAPSKGAQSSLLVPPHACTPGSRGVKIR
jgi:hypothetical protein